MTDIILPQAVIGRLQEPGRAQIENDLSNMAAQLMAAQDDTPILKMHSPTRKMWIEILSRMADENPDQKPRIDRLISRIEATL